MSPAGGNSSSVPKSYTFERSFYAEFQRARKEFARAEMDRLWESLNGNLSEGAFLQMLARVGMEYIKTEEGRDELWQCLPTNTRGYRPQ